MRGARKKLVLGVGISDSGDFARSYTDEFGRNRSTKEYALWYSMLSRCYSEKSLINDPTYSCCHTSKNFELFQYFANWCQSQIGFNVNGYQLDKDLLFKGNKIYGENLCVFVPQNINAFLTSSKAARGKYPIGVIFCRGLYKASLCSKHIMYCKTPELAFQAYKTAKEAMAKELAIQYEGLVDPRVIVALNNYVVNIDD